MTSFLVVVAMVKMTVNPTMKTLMDVTMSMKTTMTTVQHRVLGPFWSCFHFYNAQVVCIQGVLFFFGIATSSLGAQ